MYWKNSGIVIDSKYSNNDLYLVKILSTKGIWTGLAKENAQITTIVSCSWSSKTEDSLGKWYFFFKKTHHFVSMFSHRIFFLCMVDLCKMCKTFCKERNDDDVLFNKIIELINSISAHETYSSSVKNCSFAANGSFIANSLYYKNISHKTTSSHAANHKKDFHSYLCFLKLFLQFKIFFVKEIICLDEQLSEKLNEELDEKLHKMSSEALNAMEYRLESLSYLEFLSKILNQVHSIIIQDDSLNAETLQSMKKHKNLIEKEVELLKLKLK